MKKYLLPVLAVFAALMVSSCNKEIDVSDVTGLVQGVVDPDCPEGYYAEELVVDFPRNPLTKTAFNEESGRFAWTEGDELAFHLSNGEYVTAQIDPTTSKVKLYLPIGVTRDNYAVYPASSVVDDAAVVGNMKVSLPSMYDISEDLLTDYVPTPLVATNGAENRHLKFEHVGGLLQVNLTVPAGVKTAKVMLGKVISGTFSLEEGTGNGIIAPGEASEDGVTFVLSENGLAEETPAKLLVPLPAGTYDLFKLSYDTGYVFTKDLSDTPWVMPRSGGKKVSISEESFDDMREFDVFWIEAMEDGSTVGFTTTSKNDVKLYYSINDNVASSFTEWDFSTVTLEHAGDRMYIYGENTSSLSNRTGSMGTFGYYSTFTGTGKWKIGGSLFSLNTPEWETNVSLYQYGRLFYQNKALVDASQLIMPVSSRPNYNSGKLSTSDLAYMFYECSNLVSVPDLPALSGGSSCYQALFCGCTSLTQAPKVEITTSPYRAYEYMFARSGITATPEIHFTVAGEMSCRCMFSGCKSLTTITNLPFTKAEYRAMESMFENCTALVTAPEILVTTLDVESCRMMFDGCSSLKNITSTLPATKLARRCYAEMFMNCTSLDEVPVLPATVMEEGCYTWMFCGCRKLTKVPELPATQLAKYCYEGMFLQCTSLKTVPEDLLPATVMYDGCYYNLFNECSSLANAPALPATTLATKCYYSMFGSTRALKSVPVNYLSAQVMAESCYERMFNQSGLQTAPDLPSTQLAVSCYAGMFSKASVRNCPELPATQLYQSCYASMFYDSSVSTVPEVLPAMNLAPKCYDSMFQSCNALRVAPRLPATEMQERCYANMFYDSGLDECPELPAMVMAPYCYYAMFYQCPNLTTVPNLPATTLANYCYGEMFERSKNITGSVTLVAKDLIDGCYSEMFVNCEKLESVDIKATNVSFKSSMKHMFSGCSSLNKVTVAFGAWPTYGTDEYNAYGTQPTSGWFSSGYKPGYVTPQDYELGVAAEGSFYWTAKPASAEIVYGSSFIPDGWTVYVPQSVGAF